MSLRDEIIRHRKLWSAWYELLRPRWLWLTIGAVCVITGRVSNIGVAILSGLLVNALVRHSHYRSVWVILGVSAGLIVAQVILIRYSVLVISREAQTLVSQVRQRLVHHILRLPMVQFDSNLAGALSAQIIADTESLRTVFNTGTMEFIGAVTMAAVSVIVLLIIDKTIAAGIVLALGPFMVMTVRHLRTLRKAYLDKSTRVASLGGRVNEAISGIRVLKTLGAEEHESKIITERVLAIDDAEKSFYIGASSLAWTVTITIGACTLFVMALGARAYLDARLSLGAYFICFILLSYIVLPLMQTLTAGAQIAVALAALERIAVLFAMRPESAAGSSHVELPSLKGNVVFDSVFFSYCAGKPVLQQISFSANAGTITAVVGPSGSGKTTLMNLLCGLIAPKYGVITIDGVDISEMNMEWYRSHVGIVLQDTFLFSGTVYENIRYARPDASREEIMAACKVAHVDDFIEELSCGYDTEVGERGSLLSGGQRQRISVARAVLTNPTILILDEASANMDVQSEALLRDSYRELSKGRTIFIVSHRYSAIRDADQIVVLHRGRLHEMGSHEQLLKRQGLYCRLFAVQCAEPVS